MIALLMLVHACTQGTIASVDSTYMPGPADSSFVAGWRDYPAVTQPHQASHFSPTLKDITSRVEYGRSTYNKYHKSPNTWGHEDLHTINADASNKLGPGIRAFYFGDGKLFALRSPRTSKTVVESRVPDSMKGMGWNLYMTGMNADLTYFIVDEWVAYIMSARIVNEVYGDKERVETAKVPNNQGGFDYTYEHLSDRAQAVEFAGYAIVMLDTIERFEPDYVDLPALKQLIAYGVNETLKVQHKPMSAAYQRFFQRYSDCETGNCPTPQPVQRGVTDWRPSPQPSRPLEPVPPKPVVNSCTCDKQLVIQLKQEIANLRAEIASIQLKPGPTGDTGPQGPPGPQATVNVDELSDQLSPIIQKRLVLPVAVMNDNVVGPTQVYPLDGTTPVVLRLKRNKQ